MLYVFNVPLYVYFCVCYCTPRSLDSIYKGIFFHIFHIVLLLSVDIPCISGLHSFHFFFDSFPLYRCRRGMCIHCNVYSCIFLVALVLSFFPLLSYSDSVSSFPLFSFSSSLFCFGLDENN